MLALLYLFIVAACAAPMIWIAYIISAL